MTSGLGEGDGEGEGDGDGDPPLPLPFEDVPSALAGAARVGGIGLPAIEQAMLVASTVNKPTRYVAVARRNIGNVLPAGASSPGGPHRGARAHTASARRTPPQTRTDLGS